MSAKFFADDSGAVTVDWVVLTGALVGLGLATMTVVRGGVADLSNDILGGLDNVSIASAFAPRSWADYVPISNHGPQWAQGVYTAWSRFSDSHVRSIYDRGYVAASTGSPSSMADRQRADWLAVSEQIMIERGLTMPAGNKSASELRTRFE